MARPILALLPLLAALPTQDPAPEAPPDPVLVSLASRCGRQIRWRKDLETALRESARERRLVLGYVHDRSRSSKFGNKFKDDFLRAGPFLDDGLVWMLNRKFIPLRLYLDGEACDALRIDGGSGVRPLKLNDVTVPGFLFLDPDGLVVSKFDSIAVASSELIFRVCRSVLGRNPAWDRPGDGLAEAEQAAAESPDELRPRYIVGLEHLKDGRFEKAVEVFADVIARGPKEREAVEGGYRMAQACRRMRRPAEALAAIRAARTLNGEVGARIDGDLALEEAILEMRQGRHAAAEKILRESLARWPKANRAPEAAFTLGALCLLDGRDAEARELWAGLTKSNPESPWAWKAAAELLDRGPLVNGWEDPEWIPEELLSGEPSSTERRRPPEERAAAVADGVDYLLRTQRRDGSWSHVKGQFAFTESVTLLSAYALWRARDLRPEENRHARDRALAFFEAWMGRGVSPKGMGIWPWLLGMHVHLRLARDHEGEARAALLMKAGRCAGIVKQAQLKDGTWTYGGGPASFLTAAVLLSLWELREAGGDVPDKIVEEGLRGLVTMKEPGRETYWYSHRASDEFDHGAPEGAAGRMPLCYGAEFAWGKCDEARLEGAVRMFLDHRVRLMRVRKATDWHAGKFANAPYFFFYDYYQATEIMLRLKPVPRAEAAREVTRDLLSIGEIDGSWLDWHIAGKAYGTAMAILCLRNCEDAER